jgi:hypothetical protein
MATGYTVVDIITLEARKWGIDPRLALAMARQESGLDPHAVGDQGHSIGLFQLNDQGMGFGLTPAQRQDPWLNADIALRSLASSRGRYPDPGQWAAASQKPFDPVGYAAKIDAALGIGSSSAASGLQPVGFWDPLNPALDALLGQEKAAGQAAKAAGDAAAKAAGDLAALPGAIAGIPGAMFAGIATFLTSVTNNVGVFFQRQFVALAVAAVVLLVLFR